MWRDYGQAGTGVAVRSTVKRLSASFQIAGDWLRLWAIRNRAAPVLVSRLIATADGMATADLGTALFDPTLPDTLLVSVDPADAAAPRSVLLAARLAE